MFLVFFFCCCCMVSVFGLVLVLVYFLVSDYIFVNLLYCWKFGHSSRCGGFPFHCWLDCFANFVKYLLCGGNLGIASAVEGMFLFLKFIIFIFRRCFVWFEAGYYGWWWAVIYLVGCWKFGHSSHNNIPHYRGHLPAKKFLIRNCI